MRIETHRRSIVLRVALLLALVPAAGFTVGCANDQKIMAQAEDFHGGIKGAVMNDATLDAYLSQIGDRIIEGAKNYTAEEGDPGSGDREWMFSKAMQFHFVNSDTVNAFTTGGEHMYIYEGLFKLCKTEDELAAVMSHEYAHVYMRHVQAGTNRQYGILGAALAAAAGGYALGGKDNGAQYATAAGGAAMVAGNLAGMSFTRGDEAQADEYGFYFYTRAGWDPDHFGDFFKRMIELGYDKGSELLSDHPSLASRVEIAQARAKKIDPNFETKHRRPPVASPAKLASLQGRALQVAKTTPTQESVLKQQQTLLAALPRSCLTRVVQPDQIAAQEKLAKELEKESAAGKGKRK